MLSHEDALAALRELTVAAPTLDHWTVAQRATMILDRSYLKPLDMDGVNTLITALDVAPNFYPA